MDQDEIVLNEEKKRFEFIEDGQLSELTFELHPDCIALLHTFVPKELEGKGIAGLLAKTALEYARTHSLRVLPYCSYVQVYLKKHPEYGDLVEKQGQ